MELIFEAPTFKNGSPTPAAKRMERVTVLYLPKPGGHVNAMRPLFMRGSRTIDRAKTARDMIALAEGRQYLALIEGDLITDISPAGRAMLADLEGFGARGLSFRAAWDLIA